MSLIWEFFFAYIKVGVGMFCGSWAMIHFVVNMSLPRIHLIPSIFKEALHRLIYVFYPEISLHSFEKHQTKIVKLRYSYQCWTYGRTKTLGWTFLRWRTIATMTATRTRRITTPNAIASGCVPSTMTSFSTSDSCWITASPLCTTFPLGRTLASEERLPSYSSYSKIL